MNFFPFLVACAVALIFLAHTTRQNRRMSQEVAKAQLEAARLRRHLERLEMVLREIDPQKFAHIKARSDMEWQQAVSGLVEGELPTFFSLETSFSPIALQKRAE
jgi:sensor domain CHASE-containing protein